MWCFTQRKITRLIVINSLVFVKSVRKQGLFHIFVAKFRDWLQSHRDILPLEFGISQHSSFPCDLSPNFSFKALHRSESSIKWPCFCRLRQSTAFSHHFFSEEDRRTLLLRVWPEVSDLIVLSRSPFTFKVYLTDSKLVVLWDCSKTHRCWNVYKRLNCWQHNRTLLILVIY